MDIEDYGHGFGTGNWDDDGNDFAVTTAINLIMMGLLWEVSSMPMLISSYGRDFNLGDGDIEEEVEDFGCGFGDGEGYRTGDGDGFGYGYGRGFNNGEGYGDGYSEGYSEGTGGK